MEEDNGKLLDLVYNNETNKIEIFFENKKIMEIDNNQKRKPFKSIENTTSNNISVIGNNNLYMKSDSHSYLPTYENKENIFGTSPRGKEYPLSLLKLFSNSSKKSFFNNSNSSSKCKPSIIDLVPTFSNEKSPFKTIDKVITKFNADTDDNLEDCIKNTALGANNNSNNIKYVFSSKTTRKPRKLISLNEVFPYEEEDDKQPTGVKSAALSTPTYAMSNNFFSINNKKQYDFFIEKAFHECFSPDKL
jgi:hypothetical protein